LVFKYESFGLKPESPVEQYGTSGGDQKGMNKKHETGLQIGLTGGRVCLPLSVGFNRRIEVEELFRHL